MIYIVDAIMGSGKTQAAIDFINCNPQRKFCYLAPYLDEDRRVADACPNAQFVLPDYFPSFHYRKSEHVAHLLETGRNVATTHAMFTKFKPQIIDYIGDNEYTLIIDEAFDSLQLELFPAGNIEHCLQTGWITVEDGFYKITPEGEAMIDQPLSRFSVCREELEYIRSNHIALLDESKTGTGAAKFQMAIWRQPAEAILAAKDVFILTYMFQYQDMRYYFEMEQIPYTYIGVSHPESSDTYRFCELSQRTIPEYVYSLRDKIKLADEEKLNLIVRPTSPKSRNFLSEGWYRKHAPKRAKDGRIIREGDDEFNKVRCALRRFLRERNRDCHPRERMFSCYGQYVDVMKDNGFTNAYVPLNARAENKWCNRRALAYMVNVFQHPAKVRYITRRGLEYDNDGYALSVMVQWVWRSAIRNGHDIHLYIPSKRMRDIFLKWLDDPYIVPLDINDRVSRTVSDGVDSVSTDTSEDNIVYMEGAMNVGPQPEPIRLAE